MTLIEELKRLRDASTPGPWIRSNNPKKWVSTLAPITSQEWRENADNDAELVATLRNNIDTIIAALEAELERITDD